jgi:hypothetical protein
MPFLGCSRHGLTDVPASFAAFLLPGEGETDGVLIMSAYKRRREKIGGCAFHASFKIKSTGGILE